MSVKYPIGFDRDGLLIRDIGYPGKGENWKELVEIIPKVREGLDILSKIPKTAIFVMTNQAGVARGFFNEKRIDEVNKLIIQKIGKNPILKFFSCPFVDKKYAERKGLKEGNPYVLDDSDDRVKLRKPGIGMFKVASKELGFEWPTEQGFYAGDTLKDIQTALNAGWIGIYVLNGENLNEDYDKVKELSLKNNRVWIAKDFKEMAEMISKEIIWRENE